MNTGSGAGWIFPDDGAPSARLDVGGEPQALMGEEPKQARQGLALGGTRRVNCTAGR
jgi:hypothetical protein